MRSRKNSLYRILSWIILGGVLLQIGIALWNRYCLDYIREILLENHLELHNKAYHSSSFKENPFKEKPLARLLIDYGNGKKRAFEGEVVEGLNLKFLLEILAQDKKISYKLRKTQKGLILESLEGIKNNSKQWRCYLNGNLVEKDLEKVFIEPGDEVRLVFQ